MELKIVIDDKLIARIKRLFNRRRMMALAAMATLVGGATVVYATSSTPTHTFTPNTVISSSQVNDNFATLFGAVNAVELGTGIAAGAITETHLAADAVTTDKIAAGAVTNSDLAASAVTTSKIASSAYAGTGSATTIARSDHNHDGVYLKGNATVLKAGTVSNATTTVTFSPPFPTTPTLIITPEFNGGGVACQILTLNAAGFTYACGGNYTRVHWIAMD